MITITFDTNLVNAKRADPVLNKIEDFESKGLVKIFKTDVMDTEMAGHYGPGLKKSNNWEEDVGVGIYGSSRYGHAKYAGPNDSIILNEILRILFGSKEQRAGYSRDQIRDAMHLKVHKEYKRDYFLTRDKDFLGKKAEVDSKLDVKILTPEEFFGIITSVPS